MIFSYTCQTCSKPFTHRKKDKKYCSHKCYGDRFPHVDLSCQECSKSFTVAYRFRAQIVCSAKCLGTRNSRLNRDRTIKNCEFCTKEFEVIQSAMGAKYCSHKCHDDYRRSTHITIQCKNCNKNIKKSPNDPQEFCSKSCATSGKFNAAYGKGKQPHHFKPRWHKGLSADTDPRLAKQAEKLSAIIAQKIVDGTWSPPVTKFKASHFFSKKCNTEFYCRSSYERAYLEKLETDPQILSFDTEPFRVPYIYEGREHNYVPDFIINRTDGTSFIAEVKPSSLVFEPKNAAKIAACQAICNEKRIPYSIITEHDLGIEV